MGNQISKYIDQDKDIGLGHLEVIIGPMFSGKTSRLIDIYKEHVDEYKVIVVNHESDDRYSNKDNRKMYTHDQLNIPCVYAKTLSELSDKKPTKKPKIILINEGNFFSDLVPYVLRQVEEENNIVYVSGLDNDFQRNKFGSILDLIPYANKVTKLSGKCHSCARPSIFSHRVDRLNKEQKLVGTDDYIPLCRQCYLKYNTDGTVYDQIADVETESIKQYDDTTVADAHRSDLQKESVRWEPFESIDSEAGI